MYKIYSLRKKRKDVSRKKRKRLIEEAWRRSMKGERGCSDLTWPRNASSLILFETLFEKAALSQKDSLSSTRLMKIALLRTGVCYGGHSLGASIRISSFQGFEIKPNCLAQTRATERCFLVDFFFRGLHDCGALHPLHLRRPRPQEAFAYCSPRKTK